MTGLALLGRENVAGGFGRRNDSAAIFMAVGTGPQGTLEYTSTVAGTAVGNKVCAIEAETG